MQHKNLNAADNVAAATDKAVSGDVAENTARGPGAAGDEPLAFAPAPPAGCYRVVVIWVTLVAQQSGSLGYELLLRSDAHLWRPRPLWFWSDRVSPSIVKRDLDNVLVPLLRAVTAPGALTEAEAADALTGLTFIATIDAAGAVTKAEDARPARAGAPT